jgi:acetoin utilization deacetylase AcuC-like enzyme
MKIVYSDKYKINIGVHPLDTAKYEKIVDLLITSKTISENDIIVPGFAEDEDVHRVHSFSYIERLYNLSFSADELDLLGMPASQEIVDSFWISAEGTLLACRNALIDGICIHIGGGWHHAYPGMGSGFCLINDIAVAVRAIQASGKIERALIIDLDLHQGDGTAKIFQNDSTVVTFSMHQQQLFPYLKQESDFDVALEDVVTDDEYLSTLEVSLARILADNSEYDLIVYQAGVDPYISDPLGGLKMSSKGLKARDRMVFEKARTLNIPVAVTLGGGYSDEVVKLHANTVFEAIDCFAIQ